MGVGFARWREQSTERRALEEEDGDGRGGEWNSPSDP
jgi:hypothetical protein